MVEDSVELEVVSEWGGYLDSPLWDSCDFVGLLQGFLFWGSGQ